MGWTGHVPRDSPLYSVGLKVFWVSCSAWPLLSVASRSSATLRHCSARSPHTMGLHLIWVGICSAWSSSVGSSGNSFWAGQCSARLGFSSQGLQGYSVLSAPPCSMWHCSAWSSLLSLAPLYSCSAWQAWGIVPERFWVNIGKRLNWVGLDTYLK